MPPASGLTRAGALVFDLGINTGADTAYYLSRGWRAVALEANPRQMRHRAPQFANSTASLLNLAIHNESNRSVTFCLDGAYGVSSHVRGVTASGSAHDHISRQQTQTLLDVTFGSYVLGLH
eukprot:6202182-Prymnesium_polylepis.1